MRDERETFVKLHANIIQRLEVDEAKVESIAARMELLERDIFWNGTERRSENAFSDKQMEKLEKTFDDRFKVWAGGGGIRAVVWMAGAFGAGAASAVLYFLGIKH